MEEKKDLPRSIIIVLVILTVVISLLGSWTVLQESIRVQNELRMAKTQSGDIGTIAITIGDDKSSSLITGQVAIYINQGEQNE